MGKAIAPADSRRLPEAETNRLLRRADKGDKEAMATLRRAFEEKPQLWQNIGNLALQARQSLITAVARDNEVVGEAIQRKPDAMWDDLAGASPSPLEKLLVGRITLWRLQLHYAETLYAQNMSELSIQQADFHQRRIDHCHNRYLSAIKVLARVRRLQRPVVAQVNIAEQQVNVAHASADKCRTPA